MPLRGPGLPRPAARGCGAARGGEAVVRRQRRALRGRAKPSLSRHRRGPRVRSPPTGRSRSWDEALAHLRAAPCRPIRTSTGRASFSTCCSSTRSRRTAREFSIHPRFARLGLQVLTTLRFLPPGGEERAFELHGDPGLVHLDPRWHQAALRFVKAGFFHILDGTDHLLFIACLVIPFRRLRPLVVIATAFTVAHSITLAAAAFGLAPGRAVVPAAGRDAHRGVDLLHGAGEHGGQQHAPALDHRLRVRPGARLRLRVRAAGDAAVRRVAPA